MSTLTEQHPHIAQALAPNILGWKRLTPEGQDQWIALALANVEQGSPRLEVGGRFSVTGAPVVVEFPMTAQPTDAEYAEYLRWGGAGGPLMSERTFWVEREATARFRARTGRFDPWPQQADYSEANAILPPDLSRAA